MSLDAVLGRLRPGLTDLTAYAPKPSPPVKLDANESPWPLSDDGRVRMAHALAALDLHRYPDAKAYRLRDALAARLGARAEGLVLGTGSDEIISILHTALARGDRRPVVLYPGPSFVMYRINALTHGLQSIEVPLGESWELDEAAMRDAIAEHDPSLLYYATPNNPTGNAFDPERLLALIDGTPDRLHVIDEAYGPFHRDDGVVVSHRGWIRDRPHLAVMGTLSKIGLAGLRVGWLDCDPRVAAQLEKVRQPFNLDSLAQAAATFALTELAMELEARQRTIVEAREELRAALGEFESLKVWPSDANFVLVDHPDAARIAADMRERHGVGVRVFKGHARLEGRMRITVGTPLEHEVLLAALRQTVPAAP